MRGTPKKPDPNAPGSELRIRAYVKEDNPDAVLEEGRPARAPESYRSFYLKREDFEKHGYTPGCEGCRRLKAGVAGYRHHTAACRQRIEALLNEGRHPRFERALERQAQRDDPAPIVITSSSSSGLSPEDRKRGREEQEADERQGKAPG